MTIFPSPPSPHPLPPLGLSVTETVLETNLNSLFVPLSTYPVIGSHLLLFRKDWVSVGGPPSVLCILEDVCAPASSGAPLPCSDHGSLKAGSNQGSGQGGGVAVQGRHLSGFNDLLQNARGRQQPPTYCSKQAPKATRDASQVRASAGGHVHKLQR